jgi:hypothetical protein
MEVVKESMGPCIIRLYDKSGKMIEVEGSYGVTTSGDPTLVVKEGEIPEDFEACKLELKPITTS